MAFFLTCFLLGRLVAPTPSSWFKLVALPLRELVLELVEGDADGVSPLESACTKAFARASFCLLLLRFVLPVARLLVFFFA